MSFVSRCPIISIAALFACDQGDRAPAAIGPIGAELATPDPDGPQEPGGLAPSAPLTTGAVTSMDPATPTAMLVSPARAQWRNLPQPALGSGESCAGFATPEWRTALEFPEQGAWGMGRGEAGYGDGDELNVVNFGSSESARCLTQYFRSTFMVEDPALYDSLILQLLVDDGAAVYINGQPVLYHNLLANPTMTTRALTAVNGAAEYTFNLFGIPADSLVAGTNLIAVEVHQRSVTDGDMSFNLELDGVLAPVDSGETSGETTGETTVATTGGPGAGRTTVFLPSIAATIDESHPFTNYASDARCRADGVSPGAAGGASIACLAKWDVSGIPSSAIIRAAHVVANVEDASPEYFQVWQLNTAWNQATVVWGDSDMSLPADWMSPNGAGFEFGFNDYSGPEFPWALTVVNSPSVGELIFTLPPSLVQEWISQPELAHGVAIYNPEKSNQLYFTATDPGLQLVVTYDDEVVDASRFVFVTSEIYDGNLGGLDGADAKCQALAAAAELGGTYRAWLSDNTGSPSTRMSKAGGPYRLVDGTTIAVDWNDLIDGELFAPIDLTETGSPAPENSIGCGGDKSVFTNTTPDGLEHHPMGSCDNWTSTEGGTMTGDALMADSRWSQNCQGIACSALAPIYCVQQ